MSNASTKDLVIVSSPGGTLEPSPRLVASAGNGGGRGVLDLGRGDEWALRALELAARWSTASLGVRVPAGCAVAWPEVARIAGDRIDLVILPAGSPWRPADVAPQCRVLIEVISLDEAHRAQAGGAHGVIARGMEAGGRVGELSTFVLLQRLLADDDLRLPIWAAGGIGPRAAVASVLGGAAGVVLDTQLALMPECDLSEEVAAAIRRLDGSETVMVDGHRGIRRGGEPPSAAAPPADPGDLLPIGQDGGLAAGFAKRWATTAAAVRGIITAIGEATADDSAGRLLTPGAPLAQALGITVPVAQGPMTRVSDQAAFAASVAAHGGLPFIALALSDAQQSTRVLEATAAALGDQPWGVGILGFAPDALREQQIEAILRARPHYAIIAGGRPAQAKRLDEAGVVSFLHVPSPGLLRQFLQAGARRFVFEGAECGGHVGPRASFPLWDTQLAVLAEYLDAVGAEVAAEVQIFFAGGIHDARSAAMVAAMAAPLARRGAGIGILMGTAYLFTEEAVASGAIQPLFQRRALMADRTELLETAPGHATRCLSTPFVEEFRSVRTELAARGTESRQIWERLELLNVGRLRIASKGLVREGDRLVEVEEPAQLSMGLFMAGQVAALHHAVTTVESLHREVSTGAGELLAGRQHELRTALGLRPAAVQAPRRPPLDIAIIGLEAIFPSSPDAAGYWRTILAGDDTMTGVPAARWDTEVYYSPEMTRAGAGRRSYSKWGGFLAPTPFDPLRYGIPPMALSSIEPAQLLALLVADRALADAGYPHGASDVDHARTGVVFGAEAGSDMFNATVLRALLPAYLGEVPPELDALLPRVTEDTFPGMLGNVIAGRIANRLDLGGPNYTVDAACASSLTAVDLACRELSTGATDLMLCGGVDLHNGVSDYLLFSSVFALSPTGRTRTFDSAADGTNLGEGVACLVLKRLADAERDGNRIYAVIKGTGAASDGRALGLTAPRPEGQHRALIRAYETAGLSPRQVGLVEAHGTGTVVGDRTELQTLTQVFEEAGAEPGSCTLGSVKSQIGHTKCAAGLAGMIKATLAVHTGVKPPTINLDRPNRAWDPQRSPFAFSPTPRPWLAPPEQRIAGVSAFGFGGTNFHVVLAGYHGTPEPRQAQVAWPAELFCFRGADRPAAHRLVQRCATLVAANNENGRPWKLRDLAAEVARQSDPRYGPVLVAVVARDLDELAGLLHRALAGEHDPRHGLVQPPAVTEPGKVAFLFPGQGSQRVGALAELFVTFPEIRQYLDGDPALANLMFPPAAFDPQGRREQQARLRDTRAAQPVLGITGLAVEHLLRRLGVFPDMLAGHSYGELVALCRAGSFDTETLLTLSRARADAILGAAGADPGTMAAVKAGAAEVTRVLADAGLTGEVVLANHNAPDQAVISGTTPAVENATAALKRAGLSVRGLSVACAFHSPVVAAAGESFAEVLAKYELSAPRIPVWSNRTAEPYRGDGSDVREQLAAQIASPVRFVEQIEAMYADGARVFVETGPGDTLTGLVGRVLGDRPHLAVACEPDAGSGLRGLLLTLARLACAGVRLQADWLFRGRTGGAEISADRLPEPPKWTVDGQLVRDGDGGYLPGGLRPAKPMKELAMIPAYDGGGEVVPDHQQAVLSQTVLSEFLRSSREMVAAQRDVLLAYLGDGASGRRPVWQNEPAAQASVVIERSSELSAAAGLVPPPAPLAGSTPTPVVVAQPSPAAAAPEAAVSVADFQSTVLSVISERTGYPVDLIDLDLDLEADLSVDSIKRAEIAGEVASRLGVAATGDESDLEDLVRARTVRGMSDWLTNRLAGPNGSGGPEAAAAPGVAPETSGLAQFASPDPATATPTGASQPASPAVTASAVTAPAAAAAAPAVTAPAVVEPAVTAPVVAAPAAAAPAGVPPLRLELRPAVVAPVAAGVGAVAGSAIVITGVTPVTDRLAEELRGRGATVHLHSAERPVDPAGLAPLDGVVFLDGLVTDRPAVLPGAFDDIKRLLAARPRWFLGACGGPEVAAADGLPGLFRSVAREYPAMLTRLVEVHDPADAEGLARLLSDELTAADRPSVIQYRAGTLYTVEPVAAELSAPTTAAGPEGTAAAARELGLTADSVLVLVGGARGITTWCARTLAAATGCRIEVAGRTPLPDGTEPPDLAVATDLAALRAALAARGMRVAGDIERTARHLMASREVAVTLAELRELGSEVRYHMMDVRDGAAAHRLLKEIYGRTGRIDGVVYAAGVTEDRLLADKDPDSFARVYRTKSGGAAAMFEALDELACVPRFVVLFGSIAAVYGNRGQSDYAAANDTLQSIGARWGRQAGRRCLTVHWGPWAPMGRHGGMVSPELGNEYARRGIDLIDPLAGATSLWRELAWGDPATDSVVYTATAW